MQVIDALRQRRSAKALSAPAPDEGALDLILASAAAAPDHGRLRPWRFIIIQADGLARFGELLAQHLRRMHPSSSEETLQRERQKAFRAPMILVVAAVCTPGVKIPVIEQMIPREMLYIADEVFFSGTAAEITPIRSVDKISVNKGVTGPIVKALQKEFFGIIGGTTPDRHNWFTPVPVNSKQPVGV